MFLEYYHYSDNKLFLEISLFHFYNFENQIILIFHFVDLIFEMRLILLSREK